MKTQSRVEQWLAHLREEGYRLTSARYIVIEILANTKNALDASEIYKIALERYPSIGLVSVYRTLSILENLGLIQRLHQPENCQAYLPAITEHEHLILCNECGRVEYFSGEDIIKLISRVECESQYQVKGHWLQLFGVCRQCQITDAEAKSIN